MWQVSFLLESKPLPTKVLHIFKADGGKRGSRWYFKRFLYWSQARHPCGPQMCLIFSKRFYIQREREMYNVYIVIQSQSWIPRQMEHSDGESHRWLIIWCFRSFILNLRLQAYFSIQPCPAAFPTFCYLCPNLSGKASEPSSSAGCSEIGLPPYSLTQSNRTSLKGKMK